MKSKNKVNRLSAKQSRNKRELDSRDELGVWDKVDVALRSKIKLLEAICVELLHETPGPELLGEFDKFELERFGQNAYGHFADLEMFGANLHSAARNILASTRLFRDSLTKKGMGREATRNRMGDDEFLEQLEKDCEQNRMAR